MVRVLPKFVVKGVLVVSTRLGVTVTGESNESFPKQYATYFSEEVKSVNR